MSPWVKVFVSHIPVGGGTWNFFSYHLNLLYLVILPPYRHGYKIITHTHTCTHTHVSMLTILWSMCHKSPVCIDIAMNVIITSLVIVMHFSPPELSVAPYSSYSRLPFSNKNNNSNNKNGTLLLGNLDKTVCSSLLSAFFHPPSCGLIIIVFLLKTFSPFMAAIVIR